MKVLYDTELLRPGCVLLQAAYGCPLEAAHAFDSRDWLVAPTPAMRVYEVTDEQLPLLVKKTEGRPR